MCLASGSRVHWDHYQSSPLGPLPVESTGTTTSRVHWDHYQSSPLGPLPVESTGTTTSRVHWDHYQAWHAHSAHSSRQPSLNHVRRQGVQVPVVYQCVHALPPRAPKIWTSRLWQAPDSVVKGVSRTRLPHGHGRAMQPSIRTLAPTRRAERIVAMLLQTLWFHYRAFLYQ